jgi:hypothetical protein
MTAFAPIGLQSSVGSPSAPLLGGASAKPCTDNYCALTDSVVIDYVASKLKSSSVVSDPGSKDAKVGLQTTTDSKRVVSMGAPASAARLAMKGKRVDTHLCFPVDVSSSANTALTTVTALTPSSSAEFSAFATLFDEVKVNAASFRYFIQSTTTPTTVAGGLFVVSYDPANATALTSASSGCEAKQHQLVGLNTVLSGVGADQSPQSVNSLGLHNFSLKVMPGYVFSSAGSSLATGAWSATSDSADSYGSLKFYGEAIGTAGVTRVHGIVTLDVSFRSRQ